MDTRGLSKTAVEVNSREKRIVIGRKVYAFDYVFDTDASQLAVYETAAMPLVQELFKGKIKFHINLNSILIIEPFQCTV